MPLSRLLSLCQQVDNAFSFHLIGRVLILAEHLNLTAFRQCCIRRLGTHGVLPTVATSMEFASPLLEEETVMLFARYCTQSTHSHPHTLVPLPAAVSGWAAVHGGLDGNTSIGQCHVTASSCRPRAHVEAMGCQAANARAVQQPATQGEHACRSTALRIRAQN